MLVTTVGPKRGVILCSQLSRTAEERLRNCWAAPRGTAGQKHAELMRQRRALAFEGAFLIELSRDVTDTNAAVG